MSDLFNKEMQRALKADGEKLHQLTGRDHGPEFWLDCAVCLGEGTIEERAPISKWSLDPPFGRTITCEACGGAGGMICEAQGD